MKMKINDALDSQHDQELPHSPHVFETVIERALFEHHAMKRSPIAKSHVEAAMSKLAETYQELRKTSLVNEAGDNERWRVALS